MTRQLVTRYNNDIGKKITLLKNNDFFCDAPTKDRIMSILENISFPFLYE